MFKHLRKHEDPLATELRRTRAIPKKVLRQMVEMSQLNERGLGFELVFWGIMNDAEVILLTKDAYERISFSASQPLFNFAWVMGFPQELAVKHHCIPIAVVERACVIAMANTHNRQAIDEIEEAMGTQVHVVRANHGELGTFIETCIEVDGFKTPRSPIQDGPVNTWVMDRALNMVVCANSERRSTCVLAPSFGPQFTITFSGEVVESQIPEEVISGAEGRALLYWFRHATLKPLEHANPIGHFILRVEDYPEFIFEFGLSKDLFRRDKISIRFIEEGPIVVSGAQPDDAEG